MSLNDFLKKNGGTILSVLSCFGVVGTGILAAKNHEKASKESDIKNKIKCYAPSIIFGSATVGCILGSNALNKSAQTGYAAAYGLVNETFKNYRGKVVEYHGKEEDERIIDAIADEKANPPYICSDSLLDVSSLNASDISEYDKQQLFYDGFSNRFFKSTYATVLQAQYHINRNYILGGPCALNDYYEFLGINKIDGGDILTWYPYFSDGFQWIDFNNRPTKNSNGIPYISIEFILNPCIDEDY